MSQYNTIVSNADATVWEDHGGTNYGGQNYLYIGNFSSSGQTADMFVNFDLSFLPAFARIGEANLGLCQYDSSDDWQSPTIQVACGVSNTAWNESEITWNNRPAYDGAGGVSYLNIHNLNDYYWWDVTALVQYMVNHGKAGNGFKFWYTGSSLSTAKYFRSQDYGNACEPTIQLVWDYPFPQIQVGGAWHNISDSYVNVNGVWRQVTEMDVNVGGAWKTPTG